MDAERRSPSELDLTRVSSLETRVIHLDSIVGQVMQSQAAVQATLDTVVANLDKVSTRINQPNNTNWWGMISSFAAITLLLAGGVLMKTEPITNNLEFVRQAAAANTAVIAVRSHDLGVITSDNAHQAQTIGSLLSTADQQAKAIAELQERSAYLEGKITQNADWPL